MIITWKGGEESVQYLDRSFVLEVTNAIWQAIFTNAPPTPITNWHIDAPAATNPAAFFRVRAVRPE